MVAALVLVAVAPGAAQAAARVAITGLTVGPRTVPATPSNVSVKLRTRNAKRCELRGLPYPAPRNRTTLDCRKGTARLDLNWPESTSTHERSFTLKFVVTGVHGDVVRRSVPIIQQFSGQSAGSSGSPSGPQALCVPGPDCMPGPAGQVFPTYGNAPPSLLGSCTFAAAANWIQVMKGAAPDATQIGYEFANAGGTATGGLGQDRLFSYWTQHGIGNTRLTGLTRFATTPDDVRNGVRTYGALIALLNFAAGTGFGQYTIPTAGLHDVLLVGFTPNGPLVISWGQTISMTWDQWNAEANGMWAVSAA